MCSISFGDSFYILFQSGDISRPIDLDQFFGEMWVLGVAVAQFIKGEVSEMFAIRST
jgi:hypothetical protein